MSKLAWTTDTHLDHASPSAYRRFIEEIRQQEPAGLLHTGDIANAHLLSGSLRQVHDDLNCPIHFVLGNHDFYGNSVEAVRDEVATLCQELPRLHYLSHEGAIPLSDNCALVGHDGWADGRSGDFFSSPVLLNDFFHIKELTDLEPPQRLRAMKTLADEAALHIRQALSAAFQDYSRAIVLTHVPPIREACLYANQISDAEWAPFFVSQIMGETCIEVMREFSDQKCLVLCGHSHHAADIHLLPNLRIRVGHTEYGSPQLQDLIDSQF